MGLLRKVIKGGATLALGAATGKILALVRNIIIARIISPEDFGIAATFVITVTLLQSISEVAADKLLVQARDGDDHELQRAVHFFQVCRGCFSAAVILALAVPISRLFDAPETAASFRLLALIPFMRGLAHLDIRRVQRGLNYKPFVVVDIVSQLVAVLAAAPLALWLGDYRAALWVLILQTFVYTSSTHVLAERPFRASFDRAYVRRLFAFGWPLMINGALMFLIGQGDRLVIGARWSPYSLADLGVYAVAMSLIMTPRQMFTKVTTSLMLPILSRAQDNLELFEKRYRFCVQASSLVAGGIGVVFAVGGVALITLLYGEKYSGVSVFIGWLAGLQAFRIIRTVPAIAGLAKADSQQLMYTNLARALAIALLVWVAAAGLSLEWIAAAGFAGECIALVVATVLMTRRHGLSPISTAWPTLLTAAVIALAASAAEIGIVQGGAVATLFWTAVLSCAAVVVMLALLPDLRAFVLQNRVQGLGELRRLARKAPPAATP